MDVEAAVGGDFQQRLREDLTVGRDHDHLGIPAAYQVNEFRLASPFRLEQGQSTGEGLHFHRRGLELQGTTRGTIRLGDHGAQLVSGRLGEAGEDHPGEFRGAHEGDTNGGGHAAIGRVACGGALATGVR